MFKYSSRSRIQSRFEIETRSAQIVQAVILMENMYMIKSEIPFFIRENKLIHETLHSNMSWSLIYEILPLNQQFNAYLTLSRL